MRQRSCVTLPDSTVPTQRSAPCAISMVLASRVTWQAVASRSVAMTTPEPNLSEPSALIAGTLTTLAAKSCAASGAESKLPAAIETSHRSHAEDREGKYAPDKPT